MWAIRLLNGKKAGKVCPLKEGSNILGRGPEATIKIASSGVSKTHAKFHISGDKIIVSDMNSRNGTFINGVRIQNQRVHIGDKIALHDVIIEILNLPNAAVTPMVSPNQGVPMVQGNAAVQMNPQMMQQMQANPQMMQQQMGMPQYQQMEDDEEEAERAPTSIRSWDDVMYYVHKYIDDVAMPGVYRLVELFEFKFVMLGFVIAFIFLVTFLSVIPMSQMTKENIQKESQRRALTIATNLALFNRGIVNDRSGFTAETRMAEREEGVEKAFIVSAKNSGAIIAPVGISSSYARQPFVAKARKQDDRIVEQITSTKIGAAVPIKVFDSTTGNQTVHSYAVVIYNMDGLAIDFKRTLSLFIQIFIVACILGSLLYFILYKINTFPYVSLNKQMNVALKEGRDDLEVEFKFPELQSLISNINSSLSRAALAGAAPDNMGDSTTSKEEEAEALVNMMGWGAFAVSAIDERIIYANDAFIDQMLGGAGGIQGQGIESLTDPALQESLKDLIIQLQSGIPQAMNQLPSQGSEMFEITGRTIYGSQEPAYYIFSVVQRDAEEDYG